MKTRQSDLLKKLHREPEFYEAFLKKFGASALVPDPVRTVATSFGAAASKTAGTAAKAVATVSAVSGYAGGRITRDVVSWAKSKPPLSRDILARALFLSPSSLLELRREVEALSKDVARRAPNESALTQASIVSSRLIKKSMVKTGALGGLTSAPGAVPGIGAVGATALTFSSDIFYQVRAQYLLCRGIAMAYRVELKEERLQAVFLSLMGDSGSDGGSKPTGKAFRQIIDRTADAYLSMGMGKALKALLGKIDLKITRRFLRILPFLGIPFGIMANVQSTSDFGEKAEMYFSSLHMNDQGRSPRTNIFRAVAVALKPETR